jgi:prepilin signal peptidase PulO-like enzyme (type II secretory pathway)
MWWNIPLVSFVLLGGRSRCCKTTIPRWYVHCEAAFAVSGALSLGAPFPLAARLLVLVAAWSALFALFWRRHRPLPVD